MSEKYEHVDPKELEVGLEYHVRLVMPLTEEVSYLPVTVLRIDASGSVVKVKDSNDKKFSELLWRLVKLV